MLLLYKAKFAVHKTLETTKQPLIELIVKDRLTQT